jgi:electron transfer flavoprotein beta subunit
MKTVVCVKQVPAISEVSIDPETKRLKREGIESGLNPFDLYAIEEALRLREKNGGEVVILSMGPKQAEKSVREALSMGADEGILLTDRAFAGSDTWATSYVLMKAIQKIGDVDLVLCGKQAVDGDTAQVGPGIAAHLDWPHVTYVFEFMQSDNKQAVVKRMHEDGHSEIEMKFPAVVTVVKDINHPRVPTLKGCLRSRAAEVQLWTAEDIGADEACIGLDGSPTRVVKTEPPPPREGETVVLNKSPEESAKRIVHDLRMQSLV